MFLDALVDPIVKLFVDNLNWNWLNELNPYTILIQVLFAVFVGGLIGTERAQKHHAAGLRTYILVCLGATIAMITNEFLIRKLGTSSDPARLGAQVISGIGFLGAGTILVTSRNQIKGLTTAAGLWACACLGLAIGTGFYTLAIIGVIVMTLVLAVLPKIENHIKKHSTAIDIHIEFECRANLKEFVNYVRAKNITVGAVDHNTAYASSGLSVYTISLYFNEKGVKVNHPEIIEEFAKLEYVNHVEEIKL